MIYSRHLNNQGSTYVRIFFTEYITVPHHLRLVESVDVEPQILRADCKVIYGFLRGESVSLTPAWFKGQLYKEPRVRDKSFSLN